MEKQGRIHGITNGTEAGEKSITGIIQRLGAGKTGQDIPENFVVRFGYLLRIRHVS